MALGKGNGAGRPTEFTPELGAEICARIATKPFPDNSITKICEADDMPCRTTVYTWILNASVDSAAPDEKEFLNRYNIAHLIKIDNMYDESFKVAYDEQTEEGKHDNVSRAKLKVDLLKWALSKLNPEKYGERIQQHHTGSVKITPYEEKMLAMMDKKVDSNDD